MLTQVDIYVNGFGLKPLNIVNLAYILRAN